MLFSIPFSNMRRRFASEPPPENRGPTLKFQICAKIPTVMIRSRFAIIAAGVAGSCLAVWLSLGSAHEANALRTAALTLVVSWSFLRAGLVALAREPPWGHRPAPPRAGAGGRLGVPRRGARRPRA